MPDHTALPEFIQWVWVSVAVFGVGGGAVFAVKMYLLSKRAADNSDEMLRLMRENKDPLGPGEKRDKAELIEPIKTESDGGL